MPVEKELAPSYHVCQTESFQIHDNPCSYLRQ